jgi:hypothetical protein
MQIPQQSRAEAPPPAPEVESERREHRRHAVSNLRLSGPIRGDVLNTSPTGMAVQTNESLRVGWSYAFKMKHGSDLIRIPGKIQWCRLVRLMRIDEEEYLPVFRMGVELAGSVWNKSQIYVYP